MKRRNLLFQLMLIFITIFASFLLFHSIIDVKGQADSQNTTVNITVRGTLGNLIVDYFPVNFTVEHGLAPGTDDNPKWNTPPYIKVNTSSNTNVRWNVSINATNMTDSLGHWIPVDEIKINYTCFTDGGMIEYSSLMSLSFNLKSLCGDSDLASGGYVWVYFFIDIPGGQYNNTYYGDIWIYANSLEAQEGYNNNTWYGPGNTTATVKKRIDIKWTLAPIIFGVVNPGSTVNATKNQGWPTNITIGSATNVPVDLYINGTDLFGPGANVIDSHNITYSNASSENEWPFTHVHFLNNTLPDDSTKGDFANWGNIPRGTNIFSYWNMFVPGVAGGDYAGNVVAKVVEAGNDPTI